MSAGFLVLMRRAVARAMVVQHERQAVATVSAGFLILMRRAVARGGAAEAQ